LSFYKKFAVFTNFILLFCILIDPTNALFHLKDISFLLFVAINLPFASFRRFWIPLLFIAGYSVALALGVVFGEDLDMTRAIGYLKTFIFLLYIFWMDDSELCSIKFFYYLCILVSLIEIFVLILFNIDSFRDFFLSFNYRKGYLMIVSPRQFLGFNLYMFYYRTSACCVIALGLAFARFFERKEKKYFIHLCILLAGLFVSGTRANILSAFLIVCLLFLLWSFYEKESVFLFPAFMCVFMFFALLFVFLLLNQEGDTSLSIKKLHIASYKLLFSKHPLKFFFRGMGPGGNFYSEGFQFVTSLTELTYLDLIKDFGVLITAVFLFLFVFPALQILGNDYNSSFEKACIVVPFCSYLFIAGTNPLLISSTGFIVYAIIINLSDKKLSEIKY